MVKFPQNFLGWDIYPEGLCEALLKLRKYSLSVIVTENGIFASDDDLRWEYIYGHFKNIHFAMEKGVNVTGYLYWSLMDNFEWDKGFSPRFVKQDLFDAANKRLHSGFIFDIITRKNKEMCD